MYLLFYWSESRRSFCNSVWYYVIYQLNTFYGQYIACSQPIWPDLPQPQHVPSSMAPSPCIACLIAIYHFILLYQGFLTRYNTQCSDQQNTGNTYVLPLPLLPSVISRYLPRILLESLDCFCNNMQQYAVNQIVSVLYYRADTENVGTLSASPLSQPVCFVMIVRCPRLQLWWNYHRLQLQYATCFIAIRWKLGQIQL